MKIFVDSADINEIQQAFDWGIAEGVTTNPSLLKKAVDNIAAKGDDLDLKSYINNILEVAGETPVSLEVTEIEADAMIEQGMRIYEIFNRISGNVNIKVPVNPAFKSDDATHFDGIKAVRKLSEQGIPVNCTLIFTPEQALLAAKAGAGFLSPFAGRIDDLLRKEMNMEFKKTDYFPAEGIVNDDEIANDNGIFSGIDLVSQCVELIDIFSLDAEIIAASLRNSRQTREAALCGAHIATLPFNVIQDMLKHHKTFEGMKAFTADIVQEYVDIR